MSNCLRRFEGRLFAEGGCLFMVVHVDEAAEVARVTCRVDGQTQVIQMPLPEVARRLSTGLVLDNLNGPETTRRLLRRKDGWYFSAREGQMGPFDSEKSAGRELVRYILCMQTTDQASRKALRSSGSRRRADSLRRPVQREMDLSAG